MDKKFYTVKKEFKGVTYVAQFSGLSVGIRALDATKIDGTDVTSNEKLGQYIFDNVIVEPKNLTADSFDSIDDYNEITIWGREVMYGRFRDKTDTKTGIKTGKAES